MCVAKLSISLTQPIIPEQQAGGPHGAELLVVNKHKSEEQDEEKQPAQASSGDTGDDHSKLACVDFLLPYS